MPTEDELIRANVSLDTVGFVSVYDMAGDDFQVQGWDVWTKMRFEGFLNKEKELSTHEIDLKVFMGFNAYNVSSLQGYLPFVYTQNDSDFLDHNFLHALETQKNINVDEITYTQGQKD